MPTFPQLKTSAVAQYPATRACQFQNQALRFVDGAEQRYRDSAGPIHRWEIRLDALDERQAVPDAERYSYIFLHPRRFFRKIFVLRQLSRYNDTLSLQVFAAFNIVFLLRLLFPEKISLQKYQAVLCRF